MLIKGDKIIQNLPKAEKILKKHLKEKVPSVYLLYGKIMKKEKNYAKAFKYFEKASTRGNAEAMYNYAKMLFNGFGCQPNKKKAIQYVEMAKANGYDKTDSFFAKLSGDDVYNYAMKLFTGNGTQINKKEASKLFKLAIEKGNDNAILKYAEILEKGDGVKENKKEALYYYKQAVDKGIALGMLNYAKLLQNGIKEPINKEEVVMYYKMAVDNDCDEAFEPYANLLMSGYGIPPNKKEAAKYYKIAADKGNKTCLAKYNQIMNELKNESISSEPHNNAENQKTSDNENSSDIYEYDTSDNFYDDFDSDYDNQSNKLTEKDKISLVLNRINSIMPKDEFLFRKVRIKNVLNYKNFLKHNHEKMFINEFTRISTHLISFLVSAVSGHQSNGSIPFSHLSVNLLFDCSLSDISKMFNMVLLNAFSYALHFVGIKFAISIVADSKFKIILKSFEEPFSMEALQRVLDCCLIPRNKSNYAEIFYQFIEYMKTYEKDRINKNSDIDDDKTQRAFFLFTNGIDESLISCDAWKKSILNESDNSFGIIATIPHILQNQDKKYIQSIWDNFSNEIQDARSIMNLSLIDANLNNPRNIQSLCKCFKDVLTRAKAVSNTKHKQYKKPSFINEIPDLNSGGFKAFQFSNPNQVDKSIYYNISKTDSPNTKLQLKKVDTDHFAGKTGKIVSCNICKKYKDDFQTYILQTTNALKSIFRTQLDTIFKPKKVSSTDTRNYGVTVVIDASLSCFNFLTTYNSVRNVICLLCALLSAEIPCVDIILSTKKEPIILCSDVSSVSALSEKSAIWPALFSYFSKDFQLNCDLESAIHAAYDLQRMRSIKRTSYLFVFTDGLYMDDNKSMIKDQVMLAIKCGINVIGIGIGNYPIGIKDIFEQYVYVHSPEEIVSAISCLFGDEKPNVLNDIKPVLLPSPPMQVVSSVMNKFKEFDDNPMFKDLKEKLYTI